MIFCKDSGYIFQLVSEELLEPTDNEVGLDLLGQLDIAVLPAHLGLLPLLGNLEHVELLGFELLTDLKDTGNDFQFGHVGPPELPLFEFLQLLLDAGLVLLLGDLLHDHFDLILR